MLDRLNINVIFRLLGLILFLITIWFIDNFYILVVVYLLLFFLNNKYNILLIFFSIFTLFFVVLQYYYPDLKLLNMALIIDYSVYFIVNVSKNDFVFVKNLIKGKKYTYTDLSKEYHKQLDKNSDKELNEYIKNNKLANDGNVQEIRNRLQSKNDALVYDKLSLNYIRFYKNQNDLYQYFGFNNITLIYLVCHVIILIIAVVI